MPRAPRKKFEKNSVHEKLDSLETENRILKANAKADRAEINGLKMKVMANSTAEEVDKDHLMKEDFLKKIIDGLEKKMEEAKDGLPNPDILADIRMCLTSFVNEFCAQVQVFKNEKRDFARKARKMEALCVKLKGMEKELTNAGELRNSDLNEQIKRFQAELISKAKEHQLHFLRGLESKVIPKTETTTLFDG